MTSAAIWVSALADLLTAVAVVAVLLVVVRAGRRIDALLKSDSRRDRLAQSAVEREVAQAVSAWPAAHEDESGISTYGIVVRNASESVVYDLHVEVQGEGGEPLRPLTVAFLPPGTYFCAQPSFNPDLDGWAVPTDVDSIVGEIRLLAKAHQRRVVQFRFRDAANHVWTRTDRGLEQQKAT